jgi:hypothetical protein
MMMREGMGGLTPIQVPEARGYSAALDSFLAQGGSRFQKSGLFKKGRLKGKSLSEAQAEFERLWASAPDSVKNKYAGMRSNDGMLAPSERVTSVDPAMEGKTPQEKRMAYYGFEMGPDGVPVRIGSKKPQGGQKISKEEATPGGDVVAGPPKPEGLTSAQPVTQELKTASMTADSQAQAMAGGVRDMSGPTMLKPTPGDLSQQAMGSPEQQAAMTAMVQQGGEFATAGRGNDVADQAVVAASKQSEKQAADQEASARAAQISAAKTQPRAASAQPPSRVGQPVAVAPSMPVSKPTPPASGDTTALDRMFPGIAAMEGRAPAVPAPITPGSPPTAQPAQAPAAPAAAQATTPVDPNRKSAAPLPQFAPAPAGQEITGVVRGVPQYGPASTPRTATPAEYAGATQTMQRDGVIPMNRPAAPRPITPVQRPQPYQAKSNEQWNRELSEATAARTAGTMGDYWKKQGNPQMAAAFPNRSANPPGLTLGARKPLTQLAAPPPKAIPVKRTVLPRI